MNSPLGPRRFISRTAGARNPVEGEVARSCCRGYQHVEDFPRWLRVTRSGMLLKRAFTSGWPGRFEEPCPPPTCPLPPASFAELTEAGRHPPGDPRRQVPEILPSSLTSARSLSRLGE